MFQMIRDRLAITRAKKQLLSALSMARQRGGDGVSIPSPLDPDPNRRHLAMACEELVKENPKLTVQRFRGAPMLCYREALDAIQPELRARLEQENFFAAPGDDLTSDPNGVGKAKVEEPNDLLESEEG